MISTVSYGFANTPYEYSQCLAVAIYGKTASLRLVSSADTLYQTWIFLILRAAILLNTTMCVHTSYAPLSASVPANAHAPQLVSQLSALAPYASYCTSLFLLDPSSLSYL